MDRGIKDEGFVRRALSEADGDIGRWIANQAHFNDGDSNPLNEVARAAVITAVAIYSNHNLCQQVVTEDDLEVAKKIKTVGDAKRLIDSIFVRLPEQWK